MDRYYYIMLLDPDPLLFFQICPVGILSLHIPNRTSPAAKWRVVKELLPPKTQTAKSAQFRHNQCPQGYNRIKLALFYSALISPLPFDGGNIPHPAAVYRLSLRLTMKGVTE